MSSEFQIVFDRAQTISINRKRKVAQTVSRDGTVKSTSLGGQVWTFEVRMPDGPKWSTIRPLIEQLEYADRVTTNTVQINKPAHSWITGYQGNLTGANLTNIQVTTTNVTNQLTIQSGGVSQVNGYRFKIGDLIQLGNYSVYSVVADVAYNSNTVTVHRPIRETAGSYLLSVGQNVTWNVICTQFPQWTINPGEVVTWSGPFVFTEVL
jgi:hypothetical protein